MEAFPQRILDRLVMITDLLARKDRFNVPGTAAELELEPANDEDGG